MASRDRSARGRYPGRPGPSPVVAALLAAGVLRRGARVLDLGCGNGVDAVEMAVNRLRVLGVDRDRRSLAAARRRGRHARDYVEFVEGDATQLESLVPAASFDAAVDTLLLNNLRGDELAAYGRGVAHALKDEGFLVVAERVSEPMWTRAEAPPGALRRWFRFGPTIPTQLPEHPERPRAPAWARVGVTVLVRKPRRR